MSDLLRDIDEEALKINGIIETYLPKGTELNNTLVSAMGYSFLSGGKRIRPLILLKVCQLFEKPDIRGARAMAAALEMIHTYSLIHDDLPAMDDDDMRRGKPSNHKVYGEGMAILAGDGLLNLAYETGLSACEEAEDPSERERRVKALSIISQRAGYNGMVGGQSLDVEMTGKEISREMLDYIYKNKTSALLEGAFMAGAVLGGASEEEVDTFMRIGTKIGLAFQIRDDILDVTSTSEELGKPINSDKDNDKYTYVRLYGSERAAEQVERLSEEAEKLFDSMELHGDKSFLKDLISYLTKRKK